jgi:predicted transcriptional regulator
MTSLFAKMVVAKVAIPKVKVLWPKVDSKKTRKESGKNFLTYIKGFKKKIILKKLNKMKCFNYG